MIKTQHKKIYHGYTIIELMMVVVIVGVLAMIAIPTYRTYLYRSRAAEAPVFLAEIKQRQESYRSEFGTYVDCTGTWSPRSDAAVNSDPFPWGTPPGCWQQLGANPDGPVRFAYVFEAGGPGSIGALGTATGVAGTEFYFISQAIGDLDGDMTNFYFEGYSAQNQLYVSNSNGYE